MKKQSKSKEYKTGIGKKDMRGKKEVRKKAPGKQQ